MMGKQLKKGVLIAFEGIDGAGKTTQAILVRNWLTDKGYDVIVFKEPTKGSWGQKIREIVNYGRHGISPRDELELFVNDRKENVEQNIRPALEARKLVLMDRYYFSTIAYQGARGIDPDDIRQINEKFAPTPDLVLLLDLSPGLGLSRILNGRDGKLNQFEKEEYLKEVRAIFKRLELPYIQTVDGARSQDDVFNDIRNILSDVVKPFELPTE
ncbi:MAG: dTMP kinase [Candidatus Methylomirabilales bacterium]